MDELLEKGKAIRSELAGQQYVDAAFANPENFDYPMQEFVTAFCWGGLWTRPDLDRRTRSLLNVAMLSALGRADELAGHVRIAIANGATKAEIRETLLQAAIYAGMPAGMSGFKVAKKVLEDMGV
jgi:4-carboxymuconolactone decarboxylase